MLKQLPAAQSAFCLQQERSYSKHLDRKFNTFFEETFEVGLNYLVTSWVFFRSESRFEDEQSHTSASVCMCFNRRDLFLYRLVTLNRRGNKMQM